ncbi:DNA-binding domain-containing protein [Marinomonas posidonica]|uniref:DNA-binding domain-containing protein n=1 Tax=Marinomonas posidonica TaxID=936476 RepID=UPI00373683B3
MHNDFIHALLSQDLNQLHPKLKGESAENAVRFRVYQNNLVVSLQDALADIFPITQKLVGETFFRAMAREFLLQQPPTSPIISEYGANFSDFIRQFEPAQSVGFLPDVASLEYQLLQLTHAAEIETLDHQSISTTFEKTQDPSQLLLELTPNCQLLHAPFAVGSLIIANQQDVSSSLIDINESEYILLHKSFLYAKLSIISFDQACFIKALQEGITLANAIPESDDFDLGGSLAKLIEWKLIRNIALKTD